MAKRMTPDARQAALIEFGKTFFATHSYDAHSMAAIAERAGITKGLLYKYFGGRRGYYMAVVRHACDDIIARFEGAADLPPAAATRALIDRTVDHIVANPDIYRSLVQTGIGADTDTWAESERVRHSAVARVCELIGWHDPTPVQRLALYGWVTGSEHVVYAWLQQSEPSRDAFARHLHDWLRATLVLAGAELTADWTDAPSAPRPG